MLLNQVIAKIFNKGFKKRGYATLDKIFSKTFTISVNLVFSLDFENFYFERVFVLSERPGYHTTF